MEADLRNVESQVEAAGGRFVAEYRRRAAAVEASPAFVSSTTVLAVVVDSHLSSGSGSPSDDPSRAPTPGGVEAEPRARSDAPLPSPNSLAATHRSLLEAVMDALPVGMAITDAGGGLLQVNAEYQRIWGDPPAHVQSVDDYVHFKAWWADTGTPVRAEEWASVVAVREDRTVVGQVLEIQRFDGTRAVVINSASPVHDVQGRVVGSAVAIQEITELRRAQDALRESDSRFRALSENFRVALKASPVTLATFDRELRYTWVHNPRHGFSVESVVGRRPDELVPAAYTEELMALLREVLSSEVAQQREVSGRTRDGQQEWHYDATVEPLRDEGGACVGLTLAVIDIGARKRMEEELRARDRRRTDFLALLSHELRNPLGPICSAIELLKCVPAGGPEARRAQGVLERQAGQLVRLVDDLLDVSRITTNKIRLQRASLDLVALAARAVEDHRALYAAKGVRLEVCLGAAPLVVDGDATRLAQAVGNLLQNAVKFTPAGGTTRVSSGVDAEVRQAWLAVADTGIGIARDALPRLFQPFMQIAARTGSEQGGLGLGLALVRSLVELHGGDVTAESAGPGLGAEFRVTLPLAGEPARDEPEPAPTPACSRRVLIVDDNDDGAESLRMLLQLHGHLVEVATDGVRGVATARAFRPEVVVCDIGLPEMNGFDVARTIRRDESMAPPLLIALSGYALPDDVRHSLEAGLRPAPGETARPPAAARVDRGAAALTRPRTLRERFAATCQTSAQLRIVVFPPPFRVDHDTSGGGRRTDVRRVRAALVEGPTVVIHEVGRHEPQEPFECEQHDADVVQLTEDGHQVGQQVHRRDDVEEGQRREGLHHDRGQRLTHQARRQPHLREQRTQQGGTSQPGEQPCHGDLGRAGATQSRARLQISCYQIPPPRSSDPHDPPQQRDFHDRIEQVDGRDASLQDVRTARPPAVRAGCCRA